MYGDNNMERLFPVQKWVCNCTDGVSVDIYYKQKENITGYYNDRLLYGADDEQNVSYYVPYTVCQMSLSNGWESEIHFYFTVANVANTSNQKHIPTRLYLSKFVIVTDVN